VALLEEIVARVWPVVEKARAEQALRASEEQLRLVTDNLPSLISYVGADRRFRFVNAAYETWFKRPRRSLIGRLLHEVLGEETYQQVGAQVDAVLAGERQSLEATIADHRGVAHELLIEHVPHFGPDGQVMGFYAL